MADSVTFLADTVTPEMLPTRERALPARKIPVYEVVQQQVQAGPDPQGRHRLGRRQVARAPHCADRLAFAISRVTSSGLARATG